MDIFGTVFQNTRVIWLLYKRWQNLIHKSMLRTHVKKKKSTIKPLDTTKSLSTLQLCFSTSSSVKHPSWVPSVGESDRNRQTRCFRPGSPYTTCSVWEKSSSISVSNLFKSLRVKGGSFVSFSMKTTLKKESHQLHVGNTSVFFNNAEGFSVTQKRKRGETTVS